MQEQLEQSKIKNIISINGHEWQQRKQKLSLKNEKYNKLSQNTLQLLKTRNIKEDEVETFLNPMLKNSLPNPMHLLDMETAANRTIKALTNNERIAIFADYDVDGTTSAAMLVKYFKKINKNAIVYTPDRIQEGYGPNCGAFRILKEKHNIDLCITVDCGTSAHKPLATAFDLGIDVIVIDHHLGTEELPKATAIINPNRVDESFIHNQISAAAVVFLFIIALQSILKKNFFFQNTPIPDLMEFLDLVAISTICDIMPLTGINRTLVKKGLQIINSQNNPSICALIATANTSFPISEQDIAFGIGPRINACGRISTASLAVDLLTTNDYQTAYTIAMAIERLNSTRKELDGDVFLQIIDQLDKNNLPPIIMLHNTDWHQGVIGIVASKIKEYFDKTTVIISVDESNIGKASMRSTENINCGILIEKARKKSLIINGGGHEAAGGFSLDMSNFDLLYEFFIKNLPFDNDKKQERNKKYFDLILSSKELNIETFKQISVIAPFGKSNPEPIIYIENAIITNIKLLKQKHMLINIKSKYGQSTKAIAFNAINTNLHNYLTKNICINLIGTMSLNRWNGSTTIDFIILDACIPAEQNKNTVELVENATQQ